MGAYVKMAATLLLVFLPVFGMSCGRPHPEITAGTSLVQELANDLLRTKVPARTLLPPDMCPGHYDMRPGDIEAVAQCRLLLIQPWQKGMPNITGAIKAAGISEERVRVVPVDGNWMVPEKRAEAARAIGAMLAEEFPDQKDIILARAEALAAQTLAAGTAVQGRLASVRSSSISVLCNEQQAPFVQWAGFHVVKTFGRPEGLSVALVEELTRLAKEDGVALVIDNMQSGSTKMGESLARTTATVHVLLSNFPGSEPGTERWEGMMNKNVDTLLAGVEAWRKAHG
ncbi:MAG TPA: metal ABC transporter substrate-binding protein [Candidatus Hydrogenedentes bacterium]|nr:metal ABC transporter substrate-binding protein [Candidatus Hydrogenedentota bacterium]